MPIFCIALAGRRHRVGTSAPTKTLLKRARIFAQDEHTQLIGYAGTKLIRPALRLSAGLPSKYRLVSTLSGRGTRVAIARILEPWEKGESPVERSLLLFGCLQRLLDQPP